MVVDSMSDHPCVSVVVPFFESERHLAACIESLLEQRDVGGPFEVILVDNGSTDGSASIVAQFREVIALEEPTPGAYAARNAGIRRARAPLIAFTDADCVADSDWLRSIRDGMRDPSIAILLGHCRYPSDATFALRMLGAYENAKTEFVIESCAPAFHFGYANNMAVRQSVFDELGLFLKWQRAADSEFVHRLASSRLSLRTAYRSSMKITHMEFRRARERARRLSLYTRTNAKITSFRELGFAQRAGLLGHLIRFRREAE